MGEGLLQPMHLLVIFAIAVVVFGPKKLPELGRGLGQAIRGFKDSLRDGAGESSPPPAGPTPSEPTAPPRSGEGR